MTVVTRALSRRSCSPAITAKRSGSCEFCPRPVRRGIDFIAKAEPNEAWGHYDCVKGYCDTINEHLDDEAA